MKWEREYYVVLRYDDGTIRLDGPCSKWDAEWTADYRLRHAYTYKPLLVTAAVMKLVARRDVL